MIRSLSSQLLVILFNCVALTVTAAAADLYEVGDAFTFFTVEDQHEQKVTLTAGPATQHVIVSFAMGTGKSANRYFEEKGANFLPEQQAVFLANIYGMPGIGRVFAMPKMKKYPHRILIGDDEHLLDRFPQQPDSLTVIDLDSAGIITAIRFLNPKNELDQLFTP